MKKISILGSTGSIGTQALQIVDMHKENFCVIALCANNNFDLLREQIIKYKPKFACLNNDILNKKLALEFKNSATKIIEDVNRNEIIASIEEVDTVLVALVGLSGLLPTISAINACKTIALANKETLVSGGNIIMNLAKKRGVTIYPVDSEHSAIFQCLHCGNKNEVDSLILTASGGAFRDKTYEELKTVTSEQALVHPNWNMGAKVTVDSATLLNKGLEVIEAMHLFNVPIDNIEVVIHKESIIHSMVRYVDNSIIAQLSYPTMMIPIQLALTYPNRIKSPTPPIDFASLKLLTFDKYDKKKFPCLDIAFQAAKVGGNATTVLNTSDEILVSLFLSNKIAFLDIPYYIQYALDRIEYKTVSCVEDILETDIKTKELLHSIRGGKCSF